jgi:hypothetical protein
MLRGDQLKSEAAVQGDNTLRGDQLDTGDVTQKANQWVGLQFRASIMLFIVLFIKFQFKCSGRCGILG